MPDTAAPSSNTPRSSRRKAQNQFEIADKRTRVVKQMIDRERAELDAKTARLRKLRLEKEEADEAAETSTNATGKSGKQGQRSGKSASR